MLKEPEKVIAVCIADINEEYNDVFLEAFCKYAGQFHYKLLYFYSFSSLFYFDSHDKGEANIFNLINYNMIDGIIIMGECIESQLTMKKIAANASKHSIPTISIDYPLDECYQILFNYNYAIEHIVDHLVEKHHVTRFNFIAGFKDNVFSDPRLTVFTQALKKHHLTIEPERIGYGDFWSIPTNKVMDDFLASELPFPEAIVCANDSMAIAVCQRLKKEGYRVPEDVKVTGLDGIKEAFQFTPSITTAKYNYASAVEEAFQIFDDLFHHKSVKKEHIMNATIYFGESCGCPSIIKDTKNDLIRTLSDKVTKSKTFLRDQVRMTAQLLEVNSYAEAFEKIKDYTGIINNSCFWLCINHDFVAKHELSDLIETKKEEDKSYSETMQLVLHRENNNWMETDKFKIHELLPELSKILATHTSVIFFPLHVNEKSIGYAAVSYDGESMDFLQLDQLIMNISNSMEQIQSHMRQETIIANLQNKYIHDPLTGLLNRRGFYQLVPVRYKKCVDNHSLFMVISVDLNGLKTINDSYGHADGDIAISTISSALTQAAPPDAVCARFGGDEFIVAAPILYNKSGVRFVDQVEQYLHSFNSSSGKPYKVSASMGVIVDVPEASMTLDNYINLADEKMYQEKIKHHAVRDKERQ